MPCKKRKRKRRTQRRKNELSAITKDITDLSKAMVFTSATLGVGLMATSALQKAIPKK